MIKHLSILPDTVEQTCERHGGEGGTLEQLSQARMRLLVKSNPKKYLFRDWSVLEAGLPLRCLAKEKDVKDKEKT